MSQEGPRASADIDAPAVEEASDVAAAAHDSVHVEDLRVSSLVSIADVASVAPSTRAGGPQTAHQSAAGALVDLVVGTVVGEYAIERKIGQGGMGAVYVAVHPVLGKRAAIKVINDEMSGDADAIARFRREARAVAQLASPHIVDVFGFGELPDGRSYYAMEYLTGESLRDRINRGRVPLDEALDLLEHIVRGLETAHEAGVVHRDLKPENMFIERSRSAAPVVKLLDFGLVKLSTSDDGIAKTQTGLMFGTPLYVSPEQIRSAANVDHRADIYSLGCVAFELILGRVPFDRGTSVELIAAHLEVAPPSPRTLWPKIPAALDALLRAMLAKDPAMRPTLGHVQEVIDKVRKSATSGTAWRRSIAAFVDPRPVIAVEAPPFHSPLVGIPMSHAPARAAVSMPAPSARGRRRRMGTIAAVLGVGFVAGLMGVSALTGRAPSRDTATEAGAVGSGLSVTPLAGAPPDAGTFVIDAAPVAMPVVDAAPIQPARVPATTTRTPPAPVQAPTSTAPFVAPSAALPSPQVVAPKPTPRPVDVAPVPPKPVDRNQTVDPFAKKKTTR